MTPYADEFSSGASVPQSLMQQSMAWNEETPHKYQPQSVLSQFRPSQAALGLSDEAYESRVMPNGDLLPTSNGASAETNEGDTQLRMIGSLPL